MGYVVLMCECMMFLDSSVVRTCNICPLQRLIQQKSQETSWTWVDPLAHVDIEYPVLFPVGISQTCHQTWLADAWTMIVPKIDVEGIVPYCPIFPFKASMVSICFMVVFFFSFTCLFSFFPWFSHENCSRTEFVPSWRMRRRAGRWWMWIIYVYIYSIWFIVDLPIQHDNFPHIWVNYNDLTASGRWSHG